MQNTFQHQSAANIRILWGIRNQQFMLVIMKISVYMHVKMNNIFSGLYILRLWSRPWSKNHEHANLLKVFK